MISDIELKKMLEKFRDKRQRYIRRRGYVAKLEQDLFANMGLTKDGKVISVEEFHKKFGTHFNYGVVMLEDALRPTYVRDKNLKYKESIANTLDNMGLKFDADEVRKMTYNQFMKKEYAGDWDYVYDRYGEYQEINIANEISANNANQLKMDSLSLETQKYLQRVLGY